MLNSLPLSLSLYLSLSSQFVLSTSTSQERQWNLYTNVTRQDCKEHVTIDVGDSNYYNDTCTITAKYLRNSCKTVIISIFTENQLLKTIKDILHNCCTTLIIIYPNTVSTSGTSSTVVLQEHNKVVLVTQFVCFLYIASLIQVDMSNTISGVTKWTV